MKTLKFLIAPVLFSLIFSESCFSQQFQLTVTGITNFPVLPNDTAYEAQTDTLVVHVYNLASVDSFFNDTLRVFLQNSDTGFDPFPEILVSVHIDTLHANDSLDFEINYQYTQSTFKAGNNIVVVWPRMGNDTNTTYDTLQIDTVYFKLLGSVVYIISANNESYSIFPNPVSEEIYISSVSEKYIEYVRILNDIGQEVLFRRTLEERLDVRFLSEGFYFFEIRERNGTILRKKFLKL